MARKFDDLRKQMSRESQERARVRGEEMLAAQRKERIDELYVDLYQLVKVHKKNKEAILASLRALQAEDLKERTGVEVGSRVHDHKGREFEVDSIKHTRGGWAQLQGRPIRKDGQPANKVQYVVNPPELRPLLEKDR